MDVAALLCNYAEVQNNLLYISGAGIDRAFVPAGSQGPFVSNLSLAIQVIVPWTQTNQEHDLLVDLVDEDSHPVLVPQGGDQTAPVQAGLRFTVGRPPGLEIGEDQRMSFAVNMPGLPLPSLGVYVFQISIDGSPVGRVPYKVVTQAMTGTGSGGSGPASIPNF